MILIACAIIINQFDRMLTRQQLITSYSDQLSSRFHSNSMALEVLICLTLIFILLIEVVKWCKKTYEWHHQFEANLSLKYVDSTSMVVREQQAMAVDNQNQPQVQSSAEQRVEGMGRVKKEVLVPPVVRVQEVVRRMAPQLAILAVNVAMLSSYQFVTISGYIAIVLMVISEILGLKESEHLNLKFILQILIKLLMVGWYINLMAVAKPTPY